eukprot:8741026-Alexandrium_andersonii.AAC.1
MASPAMFGDFRPRRGYGPGPRATKSHLASQREREGIGRADAGLNIFANREQAEDAGVANADCARALRAGAGGDGRLRWMRGANTCAILLG